ncbi:ATP phosphoribosyltransferase [bacterium]|nr:ATP phosphoribosyltransferase [bacterium]
MTVTIAVAKGYLLDQTIPIMARAHIQFDTTELSSRRLFIEDQSGHYRLLQVRPWDVPVYVAMGAADVGIVGHDVLLEHEVSVLRLLNMGLGACRLVIASPMNRAIPRLFHGIKIATKYPQATAHYCREQGIKAQLIKLYGAIELAPLTGLSDVISDLTATGNTLAENGLSIMETIYHSTAFLIANPTQFRLKDAAIRTLIGLLAPLCPPPAITP